MTGGTEIETGKGTENEAGREIAETPSATAEAGVGAHLCGTGVGAVSWELLGELQVPATLPQGVKGHSGMGTIFHHLPGTKSL